MQQEYWTVYTPDGRKYADCGWEKDALSLCAKVPGRTYRKNKYLQYPVIDVTATTDNQLPGQQGLPAAKVQIDDTGRIKIQTLPESDYTPIHFRV